MTLPNFLQRFAATQHNWNRVRRMCDSEAKRAIQNLHQAYRAGDEATMAETFSYLKGLKEARKALEQLHIPTREMDQSIAVNDTIDTVVATTAFLTECFQIVKAQPEETVFYVSGPQHESIAFLTHRIQFALQTQTMTRAIADAGDQSRATAYMAKFGMPFHCHMHSQPGQGAGCTNPSGIDTRYQRSLEELGYTNVVGAIFGRGHGQEFWIRFWPADKPFHVEIQGEGVKQHGDKLFEIQPPIHGQISVPHSDREPSEG